MPKCDFNKVARNFIEIALRHGCSPVNLLHIFRPRFPKNTFGRLLLYIINFAMNVTLKWSLFSIKPYISSLLSD